MKIIATIARIILGAVFIYSGFVKGIDPLGSTYKFIDYFTAFHLTWLSPLAFTLAIVQNTLEMLIGVMLVFRLRINIAAWAVAIFMGFYTPLTFVLALTNPVTDCGCFGDALILTNWETFFKNLILVSMVIMVFGYRKYYRPVLGAVREWIWTAVFAIAIVVIGIDGYRHLPVLDFRPYHIGADIPRGMTVPPFAPQDEYETSFIYEKDGVKQEFTEAEYMKAEYLWNDSSSAWKWVETKQKLIKKGYHPPIHDFSITTIADNADITDEVLANDGYTFLLVAYRLDRANNDALRKADSIARFCRERGYSFYCLTSSLPEDIEAVKTQLGLSYEFCMSDAITLKTIIRANPGLVLLQRGTVLGKWHYHDMPATRELKANLLSFALDKQSATSDRRIAWLMLALLALGGCAVKFCSVKGGVWRWFGV